MRNASFVFLAAAICFNVLTDAQPLRAATLNVSLKPAIPGTPTTNLTCPTSLSLTALAIGTPGTPLSFRIFSVLDGQTTTITPATAFALPASGAANTTVTVAIPKLTGSDDYIELAVTPNAGAIGQIAKLPVSCAPPASDLAVPTELTKILHAGDCASHLVLDADLTSCAAAFPSNTGLPKQLVLTWNYDQKACTSKSCAAPDGFNILRSEYGGSYVTTAVQNHEPGQTGIVLDEKYTDTYGSCFKVQAYKGKSDIGEPSAAFCAVPDPVVLDPVEFEDAHFNYYNKTGLCSASGVDPYGQAMLGRPGVEFSVGYMMQDNTCSNSDTVHQGIVRFDLTHLPAFPIRKATLGIHVLAAAQNPGVDFAYDPGGNGVETQTNASCAVSLGTPTNWKTGGALPDHVFTDNTTALPGTGSGGWIYLDVTDLARKWASSPTANNGVVLSPKVISPSQLLVNIHFAIQSNQECMTVYDGTNLKITYDL